jgi:hypothetical protein
MQNLLRTLVPEEQAEMPMDDRIPMSKGLDMVLRRNGFVLEPKMVSFSACPLLSDVRQCFLCTSNTSLLVLKGFRINIVITD